MKPSPNHTSPSHPSSLFPDPAALQKLLAYATEEELAELTKVLKSTPVPIWIPLPGPQENTITSKADIIFMGGSGGSGKSDLLLGLALTRHERSIIFRKQATELPSMIDRLTEIVGSRDGYNGTEKLWKIPRTIKHNCQIEFGSCPNPGDHEKYRGRPHDLVCIDEITAFSEFEFRFLGGWLRTTNKRQRCRVICTGNPPSTVEGRWVVKFWSPWLDPDHPNPAKPGELRYFCMLDGEEVERPNGRPFAYKGETISPKSRTFIPGTVEDNPFLMATGYNQTLEALPEPLRSQMRYGMFNVQKDDDPWQVLPTAWVKAAQDRWTSDGNRGLQMDTMGVDVSRGGADRTSMCGRYGHWYSSPSIYPGSFIKDGNAAATVVFMNLKDNAQVNIDIVNCGTSAYDHLKSNGINVIGLNGAAKGSGSDKSGVLKFYNLRAKIYWKFRESLDPAFGSQVALPPGNEILSELCAARWSLSTRFDGKGILIESKDDIKKRLKMSPDIGESILYASVENQVKTSLGKQMEDLVSKNRNRPSAMCS